MDRSAIDSLNEPEPPAGVPEDDDNDVLLHKQRMRQAARAIDPLAPLRKHPTVTVAAAAVLGVVAASPAAARTLQLAFSSSLTGRIIRASGTRLLGRLARQDDSPAVGRPEGGASP